MIQQAIDYLNTDRMTHIDMLEILPLPKARVLAANENGVLLEHGDLLLLASEPGHAAGFLPLMALNSPFNPEQLIVLHSDELRETLEREHGFQTVMECYHAVYPSSERIPYTLPEGAEIRKLDARYVDFVHAHYHMVDDVDYIRERIEEDMFGVFFGEEIVGFAGTYDERSMGMLEILPEYRRLGLATALEAHLINHLISLGRVAFCQVAVYNDASIKLQQKMGLEISDRVIYWLARSRMK
jgi:tRNA (guanine37-N1)-methyltransferase